MPIPESHVIPLVIGAGLRLWLPLRLFDALWLAHATGWPLVLLGGLLAMWAMASVQEIDIENPARIVESGPYRFSRNPMYLAWTAIYVGAAMLVNSWWLLLFLPGVLTFTHIVIRKEERQLEQQFGEAYRQYCAGVRRYL